MRGHSLVAVAAAPTLMTVRAIRPEQFAAKTPCAEYDVRDLINHLRYWGPSLTGAARKESVPPPAADEPAADLTDGDGTAGLAADLERLVTAWSDPAAWTGTTRMGSPMELPASIVGGMVLGELVIHGWDLARATGQEPRWDGEVVAFLHREVEQIAAEGRTMGVFGAEVPVPASAPILDRTLALTGRDPGWTP